MATSSTDRDADPWRRKMMQMMAAAELAQAKIDVGVAEIEAYRRECAALLSQALIHADALRAAAAKASGEVDQ
jgi:hypothetical protein